MTTHTCGMHLFPPSSNQEARSAQHQTTLCITFLLVVLVPPDLKPYSASQAEGHWGKLEQPKCLGRRKFNRHAILGQPIQGELEKQGWSRPKAFNHQGWCNQVLTGDLRSCLRARTCISWHSVTFSQIQVTKLFSSDERSGYQINPFT